MQNVIIPFIIKINTNKQANFIFVVEFTYIFINNKHRVSARIFFIIYPNARYSRAYQSFLLHFFSKKWMGFGAKPRNKPRNFCYLLIYSKYEKRSRIRLLCLRLSRLLASSVDIFLDLCCLTYSVS